MGKGPHANFRVKGDDQSGTVIIRPAVFEDAAAIARVHVEAWRGAYSGLMPDSVLNNLSLEVQQERWEQSLSQPKRTSSLVAKEDGRVVAFASYGPEPGNDYRYQGELYAIYVLESYQRRGIGTRLLRQSAVGLLERHLPNMLLWVLESNPACQWCERLGGHYLRERLVEFDGRKMNEAAYGWPDLSLLVLNVPGSGSHPG